MQNYVTVVEEIEPEASEIKYEHAIKFSRTRKLIRVFAACAVLLDGLYSPFMLQTAPNGFEVMLNELGVDLSKEIKDYVKVIALPFVLCNLLNDLTAVDVMKEADDLALTFSQQPSIPEKQKKLIKTYIATLLLSITLKSLALFSSYPVGSSADAIPVADWIDDYFEEKTMPAIVLRYISLSVICGLETLFYIMFLNGRISQHASALVNTIKDFPSFVQNIIKHPLDFVEVLIQVSANAVNRGINLAFIMTDTLNAFFSLKPQSELSQKFSTAVGINSFGLTYFTRYLSVYKKFFNENYHLISSIEYAEASGLCKESIRDFLFSAVRGGSAGLLLYQLIQFSPWNFVAAFGIGSLLTSQSLYSHYVYRRRIDALSKISVDELERRKIKLSTEVRPLLINVEDSLSALTKTTEADPASITGSIRKEDPVTHKNLIFNKIAYTQNSKKLEFVTGTIVNLTQLVRLFAFALFIQTINNELLDDFFNPLSLFALTLLWGCEVFKNDSALYQEALTGSWTSMATRWQLEKHREHFSSKESANLFGSLFKRTARVLTSSAYDYDDEVLEGTLKSQNLGL